MFLFDRFKKNKQDDLLGDLPITPINPDDSDLPASPKPSLGLGDALQTVKSQAATPAPSPISEPEKPSFLKRMLGIGKPEQPQKLDEYGLQVPERHKEGVLSKVLNIGLPALLGATMGGVGVIPGLAAGYFGDKRRQEKNYDDELRNYQTSRALAEKREYGREKLAQAAENQSNQDAYRNLMAKIAQQNANSNTLRANTAVGAGVGGGRVGGKTLNDRDLYFSLSQRIKQQKGKPLSDEEYAWLQAYKAKIDANGVGI